ncbi:MAG: aminotransferase class I/II-fold pyridoxal phosphate-dependent enzyme [Microgenomates group bacterium]
MINLNFGPNENLSDAWLSFKLLFQSWRWIRGKEITIVKNKILKKFLNLPSSKFDVCLFFTGRSALYNLLKSLDLKSGDEVLVQAFTCSAVILPIVALNLKPVFVDIENHSFSINPIDLEKKLSKKSKVIILQHTFGITPDQKDKVISVIKQHNLVLIEDIAHGINISNIKYQKSKIKNHFYLVSFGRSKSLSSVFGGAVVGNNKKIIKKLKNMILTPPSYSIIFKLLLYKPIVFIIKLTYNTYLGKLIHFLVNKLQLLTSEISQKEKQGNFDDFFNHSYPNALAILLLNQFRRFKSIQNQGTSIVNFYQKNLKNKLQLKLDNQSLIRYPLLVKNPAKIIEKMAKKNIFLGQWYNWPIAPYGFPLEKVGYRWGSCPQAEKIRQKIINLPTNINLKQAERVVNILKTLNDV